MEMRRVISDRGVPRAEALRHLADRTDGRRLQLCRRTVQADGWASPSATCSRRRACRCASNAASFKNPVQSAGKDMIPMVLFIFPACRHPGPAVPRLMGMFN